MSPTTVQLRLPDFFIVGAPKCGTTAMQAYLSQAPDVFMPADKEFHHFADDLLRANDPLRDREVYARLFEGARDGQRVGETSVYHLLSGNAAANARAACPDAQIIAMLRNPLEVIPSLHSQLVFNGEEPLTDLEEALDAEADRAAGRRIPERVRFPKKLLYSRVVAWRPQLERWIHAFGADRVLVVLHDELRADTPATYRKIADFLGLDPGFTPAFPIVNANKQVRSPGLRRLMDDPHGPAARLTGLVPVAWRRALRRGIERLNTRHTHREPLPDRLRLRLLDLCADEIDAVAALLGRDLSHWHALPKRPTETTPRGAIR